MCHNRLLPEQLEKFTGPDVRSDVKVCSQQAGVVYGLPQSASAMPVASLSKSEAGGRLLRRHPRLAAYPRNVLCYVF
jgi:hypothetical protein